MHIKFNRNVSNFLLVQMITLQHFLTKLFQGLVVIFWMTFVACNFAICKVVTLVILRLSANTFGDAV